MIIEFLGQGRRSTVIAPEGHFGVGWKHFGRACSNLLVATPSWAVSTWYTAQTTPSF